MFKKNTTFLEKKSLFGQMATASTMGLHLVSGIAVGTVLGFFIDKWLDSAPWGIGIGFFLGVASGFRLIWVDTIKLIKEEEEQGESNTKNIT